MNFNEYFSLLSDWKRLPAYRAEPRIDSLIGFYLSEILADYFKISITGIIPELPIRKATLDPTIAGDKSDKVDFFAATNSGTCYLVEFKTDSSSRRNVQDIYLQQAKAVGVRAIMGGIEKIASVSMYKKKYKHLLDKLQSLGMLGVVSDHLQFEIVYVQPSNRNSEPNVIDFKWIADWLERRHHGEFELAFAKTLRNWAED